MSLSPHKRPPKNGELSPTKKYKFSRLENSHFGEGMIVISCMVGQRHAKIVHVVKQTRKQVKIMHDAQKHRRTTDRNRQSIVHMLTKMSSPEKHSSTCGTAGSTRIDSSSFDALTYFTNTIKFGSTWTEMYVRSREKRTVARAHRKRRLRRKQTHNKIHG